MNSAAVALAADSVATIPYGLGIKHYRAATKVLGLHNEAPIGVFWYGSPDYVGMPWEVIINEFGRTVDDRHDYVKDYAGSFFDWLDQQSYSWPSVSKSEPPAAALLTRLLRMVEDKIRDIPAGDVTAAVEEVVERWKKELRASARVLETAQVDGCSELWAWFDRSLTGLGTLTDDATDALRNAARYAWSRLFVGEPGHSGLVFAGFGDKEILPSMRHFLVGVPVGAHPRRREGKPAAISSSHPAAIIPFAQTDLVSLFMEGMNPDIKKWFTGILLELQDVYHIEEAVVDRLKRRLNDHTNNQGQPVIDAVRFLPKADLAEFARSLIAFTAFRLRMSLADESVGEPIDVAVISRGEGLVWVHRSHYFPAELNPHFFRRFR